MTGKCPDGWIFFQGKCYQINKFGKGAGITWSDARLKCIEQDSSLMEIESAEEGWFLQNFGKFWAWYGHTDYWAKYWIGKKEMKYQTRA